MARATYARVLVRLGGALPDSFWTEAKVTALCTQADYVIDSYSYPDAISTTSDLAIEIGVDVVLRMIRQADMLRRSAGASTSEGITYPDHLILTEDIKDRINKMLNDEYYAAVVIDMMED